MGAIKTAVADGVLTFMWVFCASSIGALTFVISSSLGVAGPFPSIFITTVIFFLLVFHFNFIGSVLGGASFNPTGTAAFFAAGLSPESLFSMALRFPAQAAGAVGGALAIREAMPRQYKHMLGGPSLKVEVHSGAMAEGVLTFCMSMAVLVIVVRGPRSPVVQAWLLAMATVTLIVTGSSYTGPSMNPANAFGWAYLKERHNTWEHFYVYWISPFIGAILAAWVYRMMFLRGAAAKQKKA